MKNNKLGFNQPNTQENNTEMKLKWIIVSSFPVGERNKCHHDWTIIWLDNYEKKVNSVNIGCKFIDLRKLNPTHKKTLNKKAG
jgi:hypothetical protein